MRSLLVMSTAAVLAVGLLGAPSAGAGTDNRAHARAAATTTLGQAGPSLVVCAGTVPAGVLLSTEGANAASYLATSNGVLTSFTHVANNVAGQVRAVVLANGPAANHKLSVAKSPKFSVTVSTTNTFQIRVPIKAGERLALGYTASGMACAELGVAGDVTKASAPFDPDVTNDFLYNAGTFNTVRPNISAVLEPDADNDGYGDVTQDACPQSALTQVACPAPETTITKRPKRVRSNPMVKVTFISSIAGSTFECRIDGRTFKSCRSPYRKRFKLGQHKLLVRAVSPVGIADTKPAKVKFTIRKAG